MARINSLTMKSATISLEDYLKKFYPGMKYDNDSHRIFEGKGLSSSQLVQISIDILKSHLKKEEELLRGL